MLIVNSITSEADHTQSAIATEQKTEKYNTFKNSANASAVVFVDHMQRSCAIATKSEAINFPLTPQLKNAEQFLSGETLSVNETPCNTGNLRII